MLMKYQFIEDLNYLASLPEDYPFDVDIVNELDFKNKKEGIQWTLFHACRAIHIFNQMEHGANFDITIYDQNENLVKQISHSGYMGRPFQVNKQDVQKELEKAIKGAKLKEGYWWDNLGSGQTITYSSRVELHIETK